MGSWIIVTGEYPPRVGGVSDYTRNVALGLAREGDEVAVFAPAPTGRLTQIPGVTAHPLPDHLGPRSLFLLERQIAERPEARLLVQYVPHSFGMRAMNVPFCAWLAARGRPFWVMFHEVAYPVLPGAPWRRNALGYVQETMARMVARSATRLFVSTTAWNPILRRLAPGAPEPIWIPIPSNTPEATEDEAVARARARRGISTGDVVIGAFGMYGAGMASLLADTLGPLIARDPRRIALLIGKGSEEFAARAFGNDTARARVVATGAMEPDDVAAHLASCSVVLQPYLDGVNTRRTSTMASLALGLPVITNVGHNTESVWADERAVALATEPSSRALLVAAEPILADATLRAETAARGRALYRKKFSLDCTLRALRNDTAR